MDISKGEPRQPKSGQYKTEEELFEAIDHYLENGGMFLNEYDQRTGEYNLTPDEVTNKIFLSNILKNYNYLCQACAQLPRPREIDDSNPLVGLAQIQQLLITKTQEQAGQGKKPSDLIDLAKAVSLYHRSRAQIKRDIEDGKIKDYRKIEKGKHWISKKEADDLYIPK